MIDEEGSNGYGCAHSSYPRLEFTYGGSFTSVTNFTHKDVGKGVDKTGAHHDKPNDIRVKLHNVGIEFQKKGGRNKESKIVSEISEEIPDFVFYSKWRSFFHGLCPFGYFFVNLTEERENNTFCAKREEIISLTYN